MKRQGGFTLIELVVVIVILGILAVTAAPRFLNLQNDARESALQGLKGALDGASGIVFGKAAIEGKETIDSSSVEGVATVYGYPAASETGIVKAVTGFNDDWAWAQVSGGSSVVATFVRDGLAKGQNSGKESTITGTSCYIQYNQATSSAVGFEAKVAIEKGGC